MIETLYAGIDAGGTEFKCLLAYGPNRVLAHKKISVSYPEETMMACREFFLEGRAKYGDFAKLGIASFGPVDLQRKSDTYGFITSTPKPHWSGTDIVGFFQAELDVPIAFDTDVNGALLAEQKWGAAQGLHSAVYVTIGTGIGAGVMIDGNLIHGRMHPEAGHMLIPRHPSDPFSGMCPYHGACAEGLASGPAIAQRWHQDPKTLPDEHPAWDLQAHYLAVVCVNLALLYSPQRIILGGGIMERHKLLTMVRKSYVALINGYLGDSHNSVESAFISGAGLGSMAGALGAIALASL